MYKYHTDNITICFYIKLNIIHISASYLLTHLAFFPCLSVNSPSVRNLFQLPAIYLLTWAISVYIHSKFRIVNMYPIKIVLWDTTLPTKEQHFCLQSYRLQFSESLRSVPFLSTLCSEVQSYICSIIGLYWFFYI